MSRRLRALAAVLLLGLSAPALAKKNPLPPGERIDLNRAGVAELMRLPGIGRTRAEAIVAHRSRRPFRSPAEVAEVKGIGKRWLQGNQARITAGSQGSTLRAANDP
ncbi:MAG: helix-hairpin-helix domain-containing protein [Deltaproteobacteria bacterium]|nr:helix-hairpin-helix domain-containing protein [Deltaproteobacteria bacterium]